MNQLSLKQRLFLLLQRCVPQHALSRLAGRLANSKTVWLKNLLISQFASAFPVNMLDAQEENPLAYSSFNDFFTRALKSGARPINASGICSPADGAISQLGVIDQQAIFQAKGRQFNLCDLLAGDTKLVDRFSGGEFVTIYLSPKDYHRVHMPCDGKLIKTTYVPGDLFSVNETTAKGIDSLFARNERLVCEFETPHGTMALIMVGAMIVAGIETVWQDFSVNTHSKVLSIHSPGKILTLKQGEEMGRFKLGSTVILLFENNKVNWQQSIGAGTSVTMGQMLAGVSGSRDQIAE